MNDVIIQKETGFSPAVISWNCLGATPEGLEAFTSSLRTRWHLLLLQEANETLSNEGRICGHGTVHKHSHWRGTAVIVNSDIERFVMKRRQAPSCSCSIITAMQHREDHTLLCGCISASVRATR